MAAATQPRRRRRRRKNNTITELPLDVIFTNILPRLPARYVMKYLRVSKQWYNFLKSTMFANMHLNHATNDDHQNHHKILVLHEHGTAPTLSYSNRDCETQKPGMRRHRPLPFAHSSKDIRIKSSCNGLVLVALRDNNGAVLSDLIIWNPLTNDYKTLSKTDLNTKNYYRTRFELYCISSEQDYRVLVITEENDVHIYSLKSDSWRKIKFECITNSVPLSWSPSTCWNEKLYFKKDDFCNSMTMFDIKTEKFSSISTPRLQWLWSSSVIFQRGCIYMCQNNHSYDPCIKLWSMERTTGFWENKSIYTRMKDIAHNYMEPLHLMRDGNWLMMSDASRCKSYYKVDLGNKHFEDGPYLYKLDGFVAGVYIETFVSPNQYMN